MRYFLFITLISIPVYKMIDKPLSLVYTSSIDFDEGPPFLAEIGSLRWNSRDQQLPLRGILLLY